MPNGLAQEVGIKFCAPLWEKMYDGQSAKLRQRRCDEQDASHSHFVNVLEAVLRHLEQICEQNLAPQLSSKRSKKRRAQAKRTCDAPADGDQTVLANIFKSLIVEDTRADGGQRDTSPHPPIRETSTAVPVAPDYELDAQDGDDAFALFCFPKECDKIRKFLLDTWRAYRHGRLSLLVTSEVTHTASMLIHHAADEFAAGFPHLATFTDVAKHLNIEVTTDGKELESFRYNGMGTDKSAADGHDPAEILCIPAYISSSLIRALSVDDKSPDRLRETMHYAEQSHPSVHSFLEVVKIHFLTVRAAIGGRIADYESGASQGLDAQTYPEGPTESKLRNLCKRRISAGLDETFERPESLTAEVAPDAID
ncbi:hypothetical protein B0A55_11073 [Friedmanniomyces simplex]|uniref:DUF6604 domain-containing protein n=1 Tax=Friedmanniomyces simplex TaxID=329884 RepID=A0A4U0WKS6_9PEZI|nr:hypothetical protein B0A55_11073 [Friedmanniomyces simplex]